MISLERLRERRGELQRALDGAQSMVQAAQRDAQKFRGGLAEVDRLIAEVEAAEKPAPAKRAPRKATAKRAGAKATPRKSSPRKAAAKNAKPPPAAGGGPIGGEATLRGGNASF